MNSGYFFKLAVHNLRYHKRLYLPLMVAQSFMIAMFYNNTFLVSNQEFISVPGVAGMLEFYIFSLFYVGIFACLFTVYLNFFAAKQRKHELGIYTALGMEKRHIAKLIVHENLILSAITLAGGLLLGIILSKLLMVFLCNIIKTNTTIPFSISLLGVLGTLVLFILVFFFILIARIISTNFSATMELLKANSKRDRAPRFTKVIALIAVLFILAAYVLSFMSKSPITAVFLLLLSLPLILIGTYGLFIAGGTVILSAMKRRGTFYYKKKHFLPISTLLYRLRQNAFSLGTICLLSMTTLVVIATTSCLYFGAQHSLQQDYPTDVKVSVSYKEQLPDSGFLFSQIEEILQKHQQTPKNLKELYSLNFSVPADPSQTSLEDDKGIFAKDAVLISVLTADSYNQLTGTPIEALEKNQILLFDSAGKTPPSSFSLLGETYGVKDKLTTFPESNIPLESTMNRYGLVVDTTETMMKIYQGQTAEYREYGGVGTVMTYTIQFDLTGTAAEKKECEQALKALHLPGEEPSGADQGAASSQGATEAQGTASPQKATEAQEPPPEQEASLQVSGKEFAQEEYNAKIGGIFFIGLFLSILFLLITVLVIYYKQLAQAFSDKADVTVMKKIGFSNQQIKQSILWQFSTVYLLPLIIALLHATILYQGITKLLLFFSLEGSALFNKCLLFSAASFSGVYLIAFFLSTLSYYLLVSGKKPRG